MQEPSTDFMCDGAMVLMVHGSGIEYDCFGEISTFISNIVSATDLVHMN